MANVSTSIIYSPPRIGLPYLVVTIANGEVIDTVPAASRDAARAMIAERAAMKPRIAPEITTH